EQNRTLYFLHNQTTGFSQIGEVIDCKYAGGSDKIQLSHCKDCPDYGGQEQLPFELRKNNCYCQYTMIVQNNCLNFNVNYPVDIEYKITDCSLNIYFNDFYNERRYMYFDYEDNNPMGHLILQDKFKFTTTGIPGCECPEGTTLNEETGKCESFI